MSLRLAPFQPSNEDKARINAVAEAIALNRVYHPRSKPLVSAEVRELVQAAAVEAGADPVVERPSQPRASTDGQAADYHGRAFIRLTRQVLAEVQAGRGGEPHTRDLACKAQDHELEMRRLSGEKGERRPREGSMFEFKFGRQTLAFELRLRFGPNSGHLYAWSEALHDLDDDARRSLGRWCSSVSPEERGTPGRVPDSGELIYRQHKGTLELRAAIATRYPGLALALHLLALSAWPVEVSPLSG